MQRDGAAGVCEAAPDVPEDREPHRRLPRARFSDQSEDLRGFQIEVHAVHNGGLRRSRRDREVIDLQNVLVGGHTNVPGRAFAAAADRLPLRRSLSLLRHHHFSPAFVLADA